MADYQLPDSLRQIDEGATPTLNVTLLDESGVALPLSQLLTLTLTYWNQSTKKSINGRNLQNVLNANNCTYAATGGLFSWNMQPLDTVMQSPDTSIPEETHYLRVDWTYTAVAGTKANSYKDFVFILRKLVLVS